MMYRKKPVIVEAIQFKPQNNDNRLLIFLNGCTGWHMSDEPFGIIIPTLEGDMIALPDDWIIKGVKGEFYPCKPDIFEITYEEIEQMHGPGGPFDHDYH